MKPKFFKGEIVKDDCGCKLKILKIGRKFYTVLNQEKPIAVGYVSEKGKVTNQDLKTYKETPYQIEIEQLDQRASSFMDNFMFDLHKLLKNRSK